MKIIVAVDNNWAIGMNDDLLERIPENHRYFREKTLGKVIIYGRKTLETFPGKRPLKDRINITLSSDRSYRVENTIVLSYIELICRKFIYWDITTSAVWILFGIIGFIGGCKITLE